MKIFHNLKLGTKLIIISVSILAVLLIAVFGIVNKTINSKLNDSVTSQVREDLKLSYEYLTLKYPGDWRVEGDKLYKGTTLINGNKELIDDISVKINGTSTIFLKDKSIVTSVENKGSRAVGTRASSDISNATLQQGKEFLGEVDILGTSYKAAYMPIKDQKGNTVGIYYVGISKESAEQVIYEVSQVFVITLIIGMIISTAIFVLFSKVITRRIKRVSKALNEAKNGGLTTRIEDHTKDEVGQLVQDYSAMRDNLKKTMEGITLNSVHVAAASEQLTASAEENTVATEHISNDMQEVAKGIDQQAESSKMNLKAMDSIKGSIEQIEEVVQRVEIATKESGQSVRDGGQQVQETLEQMNVIQGKIHQTEKVAISLVEKTNEIERILELISSITEQTNLLSLNASIEASHAGQFGKGFAVVAEEIRKLAEQSMEATQEINTFVADIQNSTHKLGSSMKEGKEAVETGSDLMKETNQSFNTIAHKIENIISLSQEVAECTQDIEFKTKDMSSVIHSNASIIMDTNERVQNVNASTQQQSASMGEIASSANDLSHIAEELREKVSIFKF
ncbi:methyl-accepting chemotaxis protein [Priestia filamentosa]|uniref:methyl-accepting chemotaxis protein n=1 Tax=Priestia filamentosa TaxID=1402861 RepID=UPI00397E7A66